MTAQKALVVTEQTLDALNEHLAAGWTVVLAAPMGGGGQAAGFASLVVLAPATAVADAILGQIESAIDAAPEAAAVQDPLLRRLQDDAGDLVRSRTEPVRTTPTPSTPRGRRRRSRRLR